MKQYKQYRIRFSLSNNIAQKYDLIEDKPNLIANAVEWYLSYGMESIDILKRIEDMLKSGVRLEETTKTEEVKRDEIDDAFDIFVI